MIAVNDDLKKIKSLLLKRSDLIPNQNDVKLSEHPLRICILDGDQESARMILENYHFKKWIRYQISKNPGEIEEEFSKIIFDVCMVFKEDYKYSIFIMHDLIKNCGASLNYYWPNSKITPLLLLAMRNSFKEIIYMIIKDLIKLDTYQVLSLHWDNHDSKNTILHYACQYDRFVAVFRICESVFRQEYFNLKSKNSKISSKEFTLQLLEKFALLILARNINSETPKFVADFNKPSAKYVERLENYIIITSIISRRQNIHKRIKNEIIDNGELPEDTPKYKNSVRSFVPYKINMKIMQYRSKLSNIVSLSDLITFIFDKESEEDNESKDKNIGYLKESFSTSASRRTWFNDKTHYDYIKSYNKRNQKYSKIIPRSTISFYSEQSKDYQSFSSAIKQTDDKIHHGWINLREIEENVRY